MKAISARRFLRLSARRQMKYIKKYKIPKVVCEKIALTHGHLFF